MARSGDGSAGGLSDTGLPLRHTGERTFVIDGLAHSLNYGMNRVRFPAPVPVGSRLRGVFKLLKCDPIEEGLGMQVEVEATIELEGSSKPACVAQLLTRRYPAAIQGA